MMRIVIGILEPPIKRNLCHCQFVLMFSNIHFFLGPLLIGIPSHWLFVSCSRLSPSTGLCRTWHPPIVADYHDTPVVTGGLHSAPIAGHHTEELTVVIWTSVVSDWPHTADVHLLTPVHQTGTHFLSTSETIVSLNFQF